MVLQNKYKAKASRRYNSQKASTDDAEPGSSKPGFRHRFVNKHRQSSSQNAGHDTLNGSDGEEEHSDDDHSERGSASGSEAEQANAEFPSLAKAAAISDRSQASQHAEDPSNPSRGKYARRKLGESKLARLERLESAKDPRLPDDEEPEPEVDISNLVARVAALGDSAGTQAGVAEDIARSRGQHETASDVENDVDHSLAYLHEKERLRQKAKGRAEAARTSGDAAKSHLEALDVDADGNPIDLEALQKEKEKAEAVRALKARFQGHGVGERQRQDGRPRAAPSIHIGPPAASSSQSASSKSASSEEDSTTTGTISDSLTAEIESSLAKTRNSNLNGETGSVHSGRSSFSTTFGRRKSPLANLANPEPERPRSGASARHTDRIDSFLASLNDRSIAGKDPSVFTLSSAGANASCESQRSDRTVMAHPPKHQQMPIHSAPGELGRLESFLDNMLG